MNSRSKPDEVKKSESEAALCVSKKEHAGAPVILKLKWAREDKTAEEDFRRVVSMDVLIGVIPQSAGLGKEYPTMRGEQGSVWCTRVEWEPIGGADIADRD